jgi:hypothetical protein
MTVIAKETMLLKDTAEMQVILNKDVLEKKFSVTVINKQTCKQKTYKDKKIMSDLIIRCIGE